MNFVLVGNPNSGKTTVFNHLTRQRQHIGNFPGVTVEYKQGQCGNDRIIDLPGIYSLTPHSNEEEVAIQYLTTHPPDGIINCVDVTNLRRSLILTLSLMELGIPMILVANMAEECSRLPENLEQILGIPVFWVRKQNRWAPAVLLRLIRAQIQQHRPPLPLCRGSAEQKLYWIDRHITLPTRKMSNRQRTQRLDRLLMHPLGGTAILLATMALIFYLTFHFFGPWFIQFIDRYPQQLNAMAEEIEPPLLRTLTQGAITGIGSIFCFLPTMLLLFFFLAILEDCGYTVRICYLCQHIMDRFGLSGKSIVPLLIGFGCSVPAVLSTRTLEDQTQRVKTIRLIPFFTCGAKLPVFGTIASILAPEHAFDIVLLAYLLSIIVGLICSALTTKGHAPLLLELPPYRMPKFKNLWHRVMGQTKSFVQKAFTVLLITAMVTAVLQKCTPQLNYTEDPSQSILAHLATFPAPFFRPIKLDHWILIAPLIAGLFAKESIVSVLRVLSPGLAPLTPEVALPFLVFCALYPPCSATLTVIRKETGSLWEPFRLFLFHTALAYGCALLATFIRT